MRSPLALISLSIALFTPAVASATPTFPDTVRADLVLSYTPPCTICHETDSGGTGTVTRAFGQAMRQNGLVSGNTDSVKSALDALESAKVDSDCDGVIDVQQLKDGRNPNSGEFIDGSGKPKPETDAGAADGGACNGAGGGSGEPTFGCGAQVAAGPAVGSAWAVAAAILTLFGLGFSRRRRT